jgi:8-oxo-dGTP pyrophosphatase MutT (NUDIX family)
LNALTEKNTDWPPHITVACVIEKNGQFLLVEETSAGKLVFNQPAGHLEPDETLFEAAVRETLEETAWHVELTALLGISRYTAPHNGTIYYRITFIAEALSHDPSVTLDAGIEQALWLDLNEIKAQHEKCRSPLVLKSIEQYLAGQRYPLSLIDESF